MASGPIRGAGGRYRYPPAGTGISTDPETARLTALTEAIERYASMAPPGDPLVRAPFDQLSEMAISLRRFSLHSSDQHRQWERLRPADDSTPVDWCWAFSLTTGRGVLVPAALVHFKVAGRPPNDFVAELTSTGTACHTSFPAAVLAGLCEVIERDAVMVAWANDLQLRPLDLDDTPLAELMAGPLSEEGLTFSVLDVPTESPFPVVLAVAWGTGDL
ncbi:MAG: YcaO-like family protein, partial [Candidatus Dormibacteria bacterium]